ncbi:ABC transporter permease [Pseudochryseolinea flava]|uniref:ABC transporter permease n=1 Tax=Pseudochryseolinea flava TaxID=2059302 RepID=A0A364Y0Q9_9BACT|nr:ABC transporter permease [Pseudochryseolinea flava]RAW00392.1 ABC transporter permease [Pseudochryseolinea flava]
MEDNKKLLAIRLLTWFCPSKLLESIEGDLIEAYEDDLRRVGEATAKRRLLFNVIKFLRPGILLRHHFSFQLMQYAMLKSYWIIAIRNINKSKVFSTINILGLGIAIAAVLLIVQFVMFELSYDKFHTNFDRTYRITNDRFQNGQLIQHGTITYPTIGPTMAKDFPEIEMYTRLMPSGELNVKIGENIFQGEEAMFADEHFMSVFSFPMLAGDRVKALKEKYSLLITRKTAMRYFNVKDENFDAVVGKTVYWGLDTQPYTVTGVCDDIPENSHLQFNALVSYASLISPDDHGADDSWTWSDMRHYLVLAPGTDPKTLEAKFDDFSERYFKGDKVSGSIEKFYLQPLKEAHLYSNYEYDIAKTANGKAVWAMLIVAVFILIIAGINYINLTTSRALERAKEVGLRKVMGAVKSQLVRQFIFESVLVSLLAFIVAIILTQIVQHPFNQIIGGNLSWWVVLSQIEMKVKLLMLGTAAAAIIVSGFYPAFVLSSHQPITVLKGKFRHTTKGNVLQKGLVIFQFMSAAVLITGTIMVSQQIKFMNNSDLGININNTIIVESPERTSWDSTFIQRVESFKNELQTIDNVKSAATSNNIPGARLGRTFNVHLSDASSGPKYTMSFLGIDHSFVQTFDLKVVAGRGFETTDHHADFDQLQNAMVNVGATRLLGMKSPDEIIGRHVNFWGKNWTVVGVIPDYHQQGLKNAMEPMIFFPAYSTYYPTSIKIGSGDSKATLAQIEATFKKFFPDNVFQYSYLEDRYKSQYKDDNRFGQIVSIFTILAIIISCLGLIGLSSYTAIQRTKEIGIRKVLGASVMNVVSLLSIDFMKLILIATILSLPISYFVLERWLDGYAYKIRMEWLLFLLPVVLIVVIAALTMSFQIIKTALTKPADTLKYE